LCSSVPVASAWPSMLNLEDVGRFLNEIGHFLDDAEARVAHARAVDVEQDHVVEQEAVALEGAPCRRPEGTRSSSGRSSSRRAPRGTRRRRRGCRRCRLIGGAPVRLGIARANAGHVRARVLLVDDPVLVAIGAGTRLRLRIARAHSRYVRARVLFVEDAVAISRSRRGHPFVFGSLASNAGHVRARVLVVEHRCPCRGPCARGSRSSSGRSCARRARPGTRPRRRRWCPCRDRCGRRGGRTRRGFPAAKRRASSGRNESSGWTTCVYPTYGPASHRDLDEARKSQPSSALKPRRERLPVWANPARAESHGPSMRVFPTGWKRAPASTRNAVPVPCSATLGSSGGSPFESTTPPRCASRPSMRWSATSTPPPPCTPRPNSRPLGASDGVRATHVAVRRDPRLGRGRSRRREQHEHTHDAPPRPPRSSMHHEPITEYARSGPPLPSTTTRSSSTCVHLTHM
jgi:hypothetical protein